MSAPMALLSPSITALLLSGFCNRISAAATRRRRGACMLSIAATVRASASPGDETALDHALYFDIVCSYLLRVSPPLRGSSPYPCGSLTYRNIITGEKTSFFLPKGLQPAARIILPQAAKFHTGSLRGIFPHAHVAVKNDWSFRVCGRELCEAFCPLSELKTPGNEFREFF